MPQHAREAPTTIGEFRVLRHLGSGGSADVYLAERLEMYGQLVAIKLFAPNAVASGGATTLVSLNHPGIVRYLGRGVLSNGAVFVVMEFVEGEALDHYAMRHRLSLVERVHLLLGVTEAVEYAHSRFVIHADLKPANIFVTPEGEIRLLDLSLSVALEDCRTVARFSPGFSSPEQQYGQKLTIASDIFSLGATLHTLCSEDWPPQLRAVAEKACQPEPADRYLTVQELSADLRAFSERRPVAAYRAGKLYIAERWVRRNRVISTLLAALVLVAVTSAAVVTIETIRAAERQQVAKTRLRELASLTGQLQGELYASLPPGAEASHARHQLLAETASTLAELSINGQHDPVLRQELALQYQHLATLQIQDGDHAGAALSQRAASALATQTAAAPSAPRSPSLR